MNPFGGLGGIFEKAKEMQEKIADIEKKVGKITVTGESGAGFVKATVNGNGEMLDLNVDDSIYNEDKKVLEDLVVGAVNNAMEKRKKEKQEQLTKILQSSGIPANLVEQFMKI